MSAIPQYVQVTGDYFLVICEGSVVIFWVKVNTILFVVLNVGTGVVLLVKIIIL